MNGKEFTSEYVNGTNPLNGQGHTVERESIFGSHLMLYSIYLSVNYNDGRLIPTHKLAWAHTEVMRYAGGSTVLPVSDG